MILTDDAGVLFAEQQSRREQAKYIRPVHPCVPEAGKGKNGTLPAATAKYHGYTRLPWMWWSTTGQIQHLGILLIYELPDTVKQKVTGSGGLLYRLGYPDEAAANCPVPWSTMDRIRVKARRNHFDELGVFCRWNTFADRLDRHVEISCQDRLHSKRRVKPKLPL